MKIRNLILLAVTALLLVACGKYDSVKGDPLKTRIYTLDNGLKIYINVNKETPRVQTYIAVRVGSKNDPHETTGLAHYFEHLMFKGTTHFGTQNYKAEKPLLDTIEQLFETYRQTTDPSERKAIYHRIDSVSYAASQYAIPNEYDKLMAAIGSKNSNAYTWYDMTVFEEDIPSNQIDNWAKIEADRFENAVIRGFHTELEAVYEEKNMSLTNDTEKTIDSLFAGLFPHHPYGTQTTLGTQENLKNPSITNIKNYYREWYVPNNIAICISGDVNPDETVEIIKKYFGQMKPNPSLPKLKFEPEPEITSPIVKEVYGLDAENVFLAWRTGNATSDDAVIVPLISALLSNGQAGMLDIDLNKEQKVLYSGAEDIAMADYGLIAVAGMPKQGQTLDEVRDLLLREVAKLRKGEFTDEMIQAVVANYKAQRMQVLDSNQGRAQLYVNSFVNGVPLADEISRLDRMSRLTRKDIMDFVSRKMTDKNYVIVYKHTGEDKSIQRMPKPDITPIAVNRDVESPFLRDIRNTEVKPIEPVFLDYSKDIKHLKTASGLELLYKQNETTDLFTLEYVYNFGQQQDPAMELAAEYIKYLGTDSLSSQKIARAFYDIACSFDVEINATTTSVVIKGLAENMPRAITLAESLLNGAKADETILASLKADSHKARADAKLDQMASLEALLDYAKYGSEYVHKTTLSDQQLDDLTSAQLLGKLKTLKGLSHTILYYGPESEKKATKMINDNHRCAAQMSPDVNYDEYAPLPTDTSKVVVAQYNAPQIYYCQESNLGYAYAPDDDAIISLYNGYFGAGMNTIVFQEMREARGLAYSAWAVLRVPDRANLPYTYEAFIATQNDKMVSAIKQFDEIINNMPVSEPAFTLAKESLLSNLRSQRTTKIDVLTSYLAARKLGIDYDRNEKIYDAVKSLTLKSVIKYQQRHVKNVKYTYMILGDTKAIDMDYLRTLGELQEVSAEDIFGY